MSGQLLKGSYSSVLHKSRDLSTVGPPSRPQPGAAFRPPPTLRKQGTQNRFFKSTVLESIHEGQLEASSTQELATQFTKLAVKGAVDPSEAPGRSTLGGDYHAQTLAPTQMTYGSRHGGSVKNIWTRNNVCVRSSRVRQNFNRGQIISLPFHVPNLNDNVPENDPLLRFTKFGPVYTKRRMAVVLWRWKAEMMCLPLYTYGNRGLLSRPAFIRDQFMEITNESDVAGHTRLGHYPVLAAKMENPLVQGGVVSLGGGFRVDYQENITIIGSLTSDSRAQLQAAWNKMKDLQDAEPL